jgi:hypothetical protein
LIEGIEETDDLDEEMDELDSLLLSVKKLDITTKLS